MNESLKLFFDFETFSWVRLSGQELSSVHLWLALKGLRLDRSVQLVEWVHYPLDVSLKKKLIHSIKNYLPRSKTDWSFLSCFIIMKLSSTVAAFDNGYAQTTENCGQKEYVSQNPNFRWLNKWRCYEYEYGRQQKTTAIKIQKQEDT